MTKTKILVFADLHYTGIMPDAMKRLEKIIEISQKEDVKAVICLGDTAWSKEEYKNLADLWNNQPVNHFMVLGNHDMDRNTKEEVVEFYGMEHKHYSFDVGDFHFVALDNNYFKNSLDENIEYDYDNANYAGKITGYLSQEELDWLENDLNNTDKMSILLAHDSLMWYDERNEKLKELVLNHNQKSGFKKVFLTMNGHNHVDSFDILDDIYHLGINSASNMWLGEEIEELEPNEVFSPEDFEKFGCLKYVAPYKDAVYAIIEFDNDDMTVDIKECISEFIGKTPVERGDSGIYFNARVTPSTEKRHFRM